MACALDHVADHDVVSSGISLASPVTAHLHPKQQKARALLNGPARNIMLRGGSRSGKTVVLVRNIVQRAINAPGSRHAIFRFRFNHAKTSIWADTLPKVLKLFFPALRARFDKTDFYLELPNGSQIWIAGLDDKERVEKILGAEYATLYFNESSQIPWGSIETAMSRLAQKVELAPEIAKATGRTHLALKAYYDCNPPSKLHWSYQLFRSKLKPGTKEAVPNPADYVEMKINPADNRENLPEEYFDVLASMSEAKRLRFERGEWASEVNGALWSIDARKIEARTMEDGAIVPARTIPGIDTTRVAAAPELRRIVVSVDPSGTKGDGSGDDIGIVVAGLGVDGRGYILLDGTVQMSPEGWGRRAVDLYHRFKADRILGERNFGGDMVRFTVSTADPKASFKEVVASRGKVVRAEPISALYEQGKVSHVGTFPDLEDQMCNFTANGYVGEGSPDRADALVWALTELMLGGSAYNASAWLT
jgi:phage terminase large subunit-like protein